jgi:hypothetical protein
MFIYSEKEAGLLFNDKEVRRFRVGDRFIVNQFMRDIILTVSNDPQINKHFQVGSKAKIVKRRYSRTVELAAIEIGKKKHIFDIFSYKLPILVEDFKSTILPITNENRQWLSDSECVWLELSNEYGKEEADKIFSIVKKAMKKQGVVFYIP